MAFSACLIDSGHGSGLIDRGADSAHRKGVSIDGNWGVIGFERRGANGISLF